MCNTPLRCPGRSEAESRDNDACTPPLPREAPDRSPGRRVGEAGATKEGGATERNMTKHDIS